MPFPGGLWWLLCCRQGFTLLRRDYGDADREADGEAEEEEEASFELRAQGDQVGPAPAPEPRLGMARRDRGCAAPLARGARLCPARRGRASPGPCLAALPRLVPVLAAPARAAAARPGTFPPVPPPGLPLARPRRRPGIAGVRPGGCGEDAASGRALGVPEPAGQSRGVRGPLPAASRLEALAGAAVAGPGCPVGAGAQLKPGRCQASWAAELLVELGAALPALCCLHHPALACSSGQEPWDWRCEIPH